MNSIAFDVLDLDAFAAAVEQFVVCGRPHSIHFLAAHPTVLARNDPGYRAILNDGDLVVSDGTPIALTMRGKNWRARRITSTDGFQRVCADGLKSGWRHYFVGGSSETVARLLEQNLRRDFRDIRISGFHVPPFRPYTTAEVEALATEITACSADIVWVGTGAPRQDVLAQQLKTAGAAAAIVCVGATFDFIAGTKRRAPAWMRSLGLEWLFRLVLEPRRLWRRYLIGNTRFILGVAVDEIRRGRRKTR